MADPLQVPALRGVMGDWVYYVTLLPFDEVRRRVKRTDEVHTSRLLRDWIQRALTDRSAGIADYLQSHSQRFFNALVIGVYEGSPEWNQVSLRKSQFFDPLNLDPRVSESMGFLVLNGEEKLFAIDGQHRVEGIKKFWERLSSQEQKDLQDEICAIFVAHKGTKEGLQRTRRLFTTLNRSAKPVSLTELIALDEDDIVAIVCRSLLENHPLFKDGRVSIALQKAISTRDRRSITSLPALNQAMNIYLADRRPKEWGTFRAARPVEDQVAYYTQKGHRLWDRMIQSFPELKRVVALSADKFLPTSYRNERTGGDLLFRPIFPPMFARCLRAAIKDGMTEPAFIKRVSRMPRLLNRPPWRGLLWDGNMVTRSKNQKLAEALILWMAGVSTRDSRSSLKLRLASVLNQHIDKVVLPSRVK
jgi:DNA sulfur modification protein DndB